MEIDPSSVVSIGALSAIFDKSKAGDPAPVVQCCSLKPLNAQPGSPERYRAVFSDILNYVQTMLATQLNHLVAGERLRMGCFVRLKTFQTNTVKGKNVLVVHELDVLEELGRCEKLGEPKPLEPVVQDQSRVQSATIPTSGFYGHRSAPSAPAISSSHANIYPIEALSPYSRTWTIKARCTNKTAVRKWHNRNGEGKLFNITLLDESGEIRATAFKDQCDLLYNVFEEGSVYYISSPCRVQLAKREFSNVNNDYELMFESDTIVEKAEDQNDVPQMRFNFTAVGDLHSVQSGTTIDVIGVLKEVGDTQQIISKTTGKPYAKRDLTLVDNTGFSVRLTIWSETATNFDTAIDSIIAFKGVKVSDFGGRSLSLLSSGSMNIDPDIEEAHRLKGWYEAQGRANVFSSQPSLGNSGGKTIERPHKTVAQISEDMLGSSEIPDYFSLKATISTILTENMSYPACLSENCNKKVLQDETGTSWRCEKCDKSHPRPQYRYILSLNVADYTGKIWVNCFDEVGRQILGISADDLTEMKDDFDQRSRFDEVIQNAAFRTWNFTCKARLDTYKEDARIRYELISAIPLDFPSEAIRLADVIKSYDSSQV